LAAVAFAVAFTVKFLPIVLLPLYWKRFRIRDAALAVVAVVLLYVPFLNHGRIPTGSLSTYLTSFRFNGPAFAILHHVFPAQVLAAIAVLAGVVTAACLRNTNQKWFPAAFAWPMAAALFCAPVVFPWYLLWLLPFLTSTSTLLIIIWTVSIYPTYLMWHMRAVSGTWGSLPMWVMLLEYGIIGIAAAVLVFRRVTKPRMQPSTDAIG
jgi:hypothetical protein